MPGRKATSEFRASLCEFLLHFPFLHLLFKTYLAASDLSCGTRELHHVMWDLLTVAGRLSGSTACGIFLLP